MNKILAFLIAVASVFVLPAVILAQGGQQGQGGQQQALGSRGIETATQNLNRVTERINNPETGEQIQSMIQNHEMIQARTNTALQQMNQRNQMLKFLIGPDYKNAGQVRSDLVGLRNDIKKLEQIKEESSLTDNEDIQEAIDDLEFEADELETELANQLSGFSLFGWLAKLFVK